MELNWKNKYEDQLKCIKRMVKSSFLKLIGAFFVLIYLLCNLCIPAFVFISVIFSPLFYTAEIKFYIETVDHVLFAPSIRSKQTNCSWTCKTFRTKFSVQDIILFVQVHLKDEVNGKNIDFCLFYKYLFHLETRSTPNSGRWR